MLLKHMYNKIQYKKIQRVRGTASLETTHWTFTNTIGIKKKEFQGYHAVFDYVIIAFCPFNTIPAIQYRHIADGQMDRQIDIGTKSWHISRAAETRDS